MQQPEHETHYQRIAREQAERRQARLAPKRRRRPRPDAWQNDTGPAFPRDPDGYDRDNLGLSPDY